MTDPIIKSIRLQQSNDTKALRKRLNSLAKEGKLQVNGTQLSISDMWFFIARKVGVVAESRVSGYPPPPTKPLPKIYQRQRKDGTTYLSKFKSMKQQVFVVLKMQKDGRYRRTGLLGRSITSNVKRKSANLYEVQVGTNVDYAPHVIGEEDDQAAIHVDRWTPLSEDIGSSEAQDDYDDVIQTEVRGILGALLGN